MYFHALRVSQSDMTTQLLVKHKAETRNWILEPEKNVAGWF